MNLPEHLKEHAAIKNQIDAGRIKGKTVDDAAIANGFALVYNSTSGNIEYSDIGTQIEIDAHIDAHTDIHGIVDATNLVTLSGAQTFTGTKTFGTTAGIDHTDLGNIGSNTHAQIDTDIANSIAHLADNTQAHSDYLLNTTDSLVGTLDISVALDVPELANTAGNLNLVPDVEGDIVCFNDTDVDDGSDSRKIVVWRRAAEGDNSMALLVNQFRSQLVQSDGNLIVQSGVTMKLRAQNGANTITNDCGTMIIGDPTRSNNPPVQINGRITAAGAQIYGEFVVNDTTDMFTLNRESTDILGFDVNMPTTVHQDQAAGAIPVLKLQQDDIDDSFLDFIGTSAADGTRSISSDTTEDSAKFGAVQIEVNGVSKWIRIYDDES